MKYITRLFIIILISFVGELLHYIIPVHIPGSIYGFIILFFLLCTKTIKLDFIKPVTDFLLSILPMVFIAPGAALVGVGDEFKKMFIPVILSATISTFIVMSTVGIIVEKMLTKNKNKEKK